MATNRKRPSDIGEATKRELKDRSAEPHRLHDLDQFEIAARAITTALAQGNFDLARAATEAEIQKLEDQARRTPFYQSTLADIGVEPECCHYLEIKLNVLTIEDFLNQPMDKILAIRGIGPLRLLDALRRLLIHSLRYIKE